MTSKKTLSMAINAFKGAGVKYWDEQAEQSCSHPIKKPAVKISSSVTENKTYSKSRSDRSSSLDQQSMFNTKASSVKLLRAKENKREKIAPFNLNVEELEKVLSSHTFNSDNYTSKLSKTLGFGSASGSFQLNRKHGLTFSDNAGPEVIPDFHVFNRNGNIASSNSNISIITTYDINLRTWEENEQKLTTPRHCTDRATSHHQLMSSQTEVFKVSEVSPDIVEFLDKKNEIFFKDLILYQRSMLSGYLWDKQQVTEPDTEVTSTIGSSTSRMSTVSKPFLTVKDSRTFANSNNKSRTRLRTNLQNDFAISRSVSVSSGKSKKSSVKRNVAFQ